MAKNDKSSESAPQGPYGPYAPWGQPPAWAAGPAPWGAPGPGMPAGAPHWPWPGPWGQGAHPETPHHDPSRARGPQQPHSHDTASGGCSGSHDAPTADASHSCGSSGSSHSHTSAPQGQAPWGPMPGQQTPWGPMPGTPWGPAGYNAAPQGYTAWGNSWSHQDWTRGWLHFQNPAYVKGMIVGALASAVVTNPAAQKKTMQTLASIWGMLQGGVEELKERFRDMEAEMQAAARNAADNGETDPKKPAPKT